MRSFSIAFALFLAAGVAYAQLALTGAGKTGGGGGGSSNFILMVDNSSRILQIDNASKICLAGGC